MNETLDEQSRCSLVRYRIERADETIDEAIHKRYTKGTVLFVYSKAKSRQIVWRFASFFVILQA